MKSYKCTLITPQGSLFDGQASSVVAPGVEGIFQILAGHEHIVAVLKKGILKIKVEDNDAYYAIDSGVLEVDGDRAVVILADKAMAAQNEEDAKAKVLDIDKVITKAAVQV